MMKKLQTLLGFLTKQIIRKHKPMVIGITGSVGKTSAKEAIFAVVAPQVSARATIENYNNEFGVPLTVVGMKSPGKNPLGWLKVIAKMCTLAYTKQENFPQVLVLEMGADRPGDIAYLMDMAPIDIGVLTSIGEAHYEFFDSIDGIKNEKKTILTRLSEAQWAIFNNDDETIKSTLSEVTAQKLSFGFNAEALVRATAVRVRYAEMDGYQKPIGMRFTVEYEGAKVPMFIPGVLGHGHVKAALAGCSVGIALGMNLIDIGRGVSKSHMRGGRMRLLNGIKKSTLIDDTYNASPLATIFALDALRECTVAQGAKRIAVLGDMLELGGISEQLHKDIGTRIQAFNVDVLVTIGSQAKYIAQEAISCGFNEKNVYTFATSAEAIERVVSLVGERDLILLKGSQGARVEKITKALLEKQAQDAKLLCRQSESWQT